jgi:hypothetical protein
VQETLADPELMTLLGEMLAQLRPEGAVSLRATVPVNPVTALIVMLELVDAPALIGAGEVALIVKLVTVNVALVLWLSAPLVPVMVRM